MMLVHNVSVDPRRTQTQWPLHRSVQTQVQGAMLLLEEAQETLVQVIA